MRTAQQPLASSLLLLAGFVLAGLTVADLRADNLRAGDSRAEDSRVDDLRTKAIPIALTDAEGNDPFRDLVPVGESMRDTRLVMIGTPTRGDANAMAMQVRLVRFLHERLGFDVLAFESGFYSSKAGWRDIVAGRPVAEAVTDTLFPVYSEALAFQPLIDYVESQARGETPLRLAGYGLLGGLEPGEPHLIVDLRAALHACRAPDLDAKTLEILRNLAHESYAASQAELPSRGQRKAFEKEVARLGKLFETSTSCAAEVDRSLWRQTMDSLGAAAQEAWDIGVFDPAHPGIDTAITTRSYRQEAKNLFWILNGPAERPAASPQHKVIVWSMTIQFVRNLDLLTTGDPAARERFDHLTTLGDLVHQRLGDEAYTLALTAHQGQNGSFFKNPYKLLAPTEGSFEDLMFRSGLEAAFVDLRKPPPGSKWLQDPLIARPLSFKEVMGIWRRNVDGFLFLRDAAPQQRVVAGSR